MRRAAKELVAEIRSHLRKRRDLARLRDELLVRAVEYARLASFGASLEDGAWHLHCKADGDALAKHKLEELGAYCTRIARELTIIVPLERNALTLEEQAALWRSGGRHGPCRS